MLELNTIDKLALLMIMIVGLPHGALDGAIVLGISNIKSIKKIFLFFINYILLAMFTFLLWHLSPAISLFLFLIYSLIHFGLGDIDYNNSKNKYYRLLGVFVHGGLIIIAIPFYHQESVFLFFNILAGENVIVYFNIIDFLISLWAVSLSLYFISCLKLKNYFPMIELLFLLLIIFTFSPLISFSIYFCFIHSRKHFRMIWNTLKKLISKKMIIVIGSFLTFTSWLLAFLFYNYQIDKFTSEEAFVRVVFILLAVLTVPHMILVDSIFRPIADKIKIKY